MPKQMASNPRYPPPGGGLQEEVLDTPGLPGRWGWAPANTFIPNSDSNINAKWLKAEWGWGGDGEWGMASGGGGEGQILTDLLHLCDKGNNSLG